MDRSPGGCHPHAFPREARIRSVRDFGRVYRRRATASDDFLLVFACENDASRPRLGLSVSRKVGGAVARNRWKRCVREAFRLSQAELPSGVDLVCVPRAAQPPSLAQLRESLERLAGRAARRLKK